MRLIAEQFVDSPSFYVFIDQANLKQLTCLKWFLLEWTYDRGLHWHIELDRTFLFLTIVSRVDIQSHLSEALLDFQSTDLTALAAELPCVPMAFTPYSNPI